MSLYEDKYLKYLPYFEKDYEIGFTRPDEIGDVMKFIDCYWKKGHALAVSRELMDWQHYDAANDRYMLTIARHRASGEIHALQGHITSRQFDPAIKDFIAWGAIWKMREEVATTGLGAMMELHVLHALDPHTVSGLGKSEHSLKISKHRGDFTGRVNRYYILNDKMGAYQLCVPDGAPCFTPADSGTDAFVMLRLNDYEASAASVFGKILPYKSKTYYVNRYYKHPLYHYEVTGMRTADGDIKAILFWRFCEFCGQRCIRIVDYIGDGSELIGNLKNFRQLLYDTGAEFIDFIQYGIPKEYFLMGGFVDLHNTKAVLANYFEPFLLKNVELDFNFKSKNRTLQPMIFKGDADQDRPNIIL